MIGDSTSKLTSGDNSVIDCFPNSACCKLMQKLYIDAHCDPIEVFRISQVLDDTNMPSVELFVLYSLTQGDQTSVNRALQENSY